MENTTFVNQGLTLLTESLDPPKIVSRYLPVNFDTIFKATLLFENLRSLVSAWDTIVHWLRGFMITQCKLGKLPIAQWVGPFCTSQCALAMRILH